MHQQQDEERFRVIQFLPSLHRAIPSLPNPVEQGMITVNSAGLGVASPELVEQRAEELAAINGRDPEWFSDPIGIRLAAN